MVRVVPGSSRRRSSSNKSGGVNNNNAASDTAGSNSNSNSNNNKTTTTDDAHPNKAHHHHRHGRHSYRNLYHNDYHHSSPSSTLAGRFMVLLLGMAIGIYLVKHHEKQMDDTYYTLLNTVIPDNQASPINDDDFRTGHSRVVVQTSNYSSSNGLTLPAKTKTMSSTSTSTAAKITSSKGRSNLSSKSSSAANANTATTNRKGTTATKTTATNTSSATTVKKVAPAVQAVPYYPRPRTDGKVWFWNHRAVSDWHHVRQGGLAVSWIIAYYTGHAIQQQHPMPSQQFLWNQTLLTQFVHWENLHVPDGTTFKQIAKERRKGITKITPDVKYSNRKNVQDELKERTNIGVYSGSNGWSFVRYTFPWLDPFETSDPATTTTFKRMMRAFTYNDKIQELADKVIAEMWGVSAYGDQTDNFMGLEVLTDHRPAVDCKAYGSKVYPKTTATSTASTTKISSNSTTSEDPSLLLPGSCVDVDWKDIIKGRGGQQKMPIYVSHNLRQDQTFDAAKVLGKAAVAGSRGDSANIYQRSDFDFLASRRLGIISAVEQVVMTRAKYFVASVHSPWSDYVILKRIYGDNNGNSGKLDGEANYKIWKDKLSYRVEEPKSLSSLSPVALDSDADSSSTSVLASDDASTTTKAQASNKAAAPRKAKVLSSRKTTKKTYNIATKAGGGNKKKSINKVKQEATTAAAWAKKLKEESSS